MTIHVQRCADCGTVNYPAREICRNCLSDRLAEVEDTGAGQLLAVATLHRSLEPAYDTVLPVRIGTVKLDCGPQVIAFVGDDSASGDCVSLEPMVQPLGQPAWLARRT